MLYYWFSGYISKNKIIIFHIFNATFFIFRFLSTWLNTRTVTSDRTCMSVFTHPTKNPTRSEPTCGLPYEKELVDLAFKKVSWSRDFCKRHNLIWQKSENDSIKEKFLWNIMRCLCYVIFWNRGTNWNEKHLRCINCKNLTASPNSSLPYV